MNVYIGIDLGGTNIKLGLFDANENMLNRTAIATGADDGPQAVVDRIGGELEDLLKKQDMTFDHIAAAGIVSPGLVDTENGIVRATSNIHFTNVPLRQMMSDRLGGKPVVLENDANVTCWAEHVAGVGRGIDNMILITLGTGVGGGVLCNGRLVHGFDDNAGEIGHIIIRPHGRLCGCGQRGCVEAYASASATAARAREAIEAGKASSLKALLDQNGNLTGKDVYDHAAAEDPLARKITDGTAEALALLCIGMLHLTGPEKIVFFGGMIRAGDLLIKPIRQFFNHHIWAIKQERIELCFAQLGDNAGIIGAASLAAHALKNPGHS